MRTTVNLDEDVLLAARERARREHRSIGSVLSDLAREGLTASRHSGALPPSHHGFEPVPSRGGTVTNTLIDEIREDEAE